MIRLRWIAALGLTAVTAAAMPRALFAQLTQPNATQPAPEPDPITLLQASESSEEVRDLAALRIVSAKNPDQLATLVSLIKDDQIGQSIARALAQISWPRQEFIDPLYVLLNSHDPSRVEAAAQALAQYPADGNVLGRLLAVASLKSSEEIRLPIIRALSSFSQKRAAAQLIEWLSDDDSAKIQAASADVLMDMTGNYDFKHDSQLWQNWWAQNSAKSDADFAAALRDSRGRGYAIEIARRKKLEAATLKLLSGQYEQAPPDQKSDILLHYLRSTAPEIQILGINLVYERRGADDRSLPNLLNEVRTLLPNDSPDVRAAAAAALRGEVNSAQALIDQLTRETDDSVRAELLHSLAPLDDVHAINLMLTIVSSNSSLPVRTAAAEGIHHAKDVISKDVDLKTRTIKVLKDALLATQAKPGTQHFRGALVAALADMADPSLQFLFSSLIADQNEPLGVRQNALRGLGNLPDPAPFTDQIANYLDNDAPELRRAAVTALGNVHDPKFMGIFKNKLEVSLKDQDDSVRAEAWRVLQEWMPLVDETDLQAMADDLKTIDPSKQFEALKALRKRLAADAQAAPDDSSRAKASSQLAITDQNIGDLLLVQLGRPSEAANSYQSSLDYWKKNNGQFQTLDRLTGDAIEALLGAKRWSDATAFASQAIKDYDPKPDLKPIEETIGQQFVAAAENLLKRDDPDAYSDAGAFFAAIKAMNPALTGSYPEQLDGIQQEIEKKHRS